MNIEEASRLQHWKEFVVKQRRHHDTDQWRIQDILDGLAPHQMVGAPTY